MPTQKVNVVIVEENTERRELLHKHILKPQGFDVHAASNATEGISLAGKLEPDIIIANINLSGLSGKDLLIALSSQGIDTPVILLADQEMEKEAIRAFRLGAVDYLSLPLKETEVISAVERVLTKPQPSTPSSTVQPQKKISFLEDRIKDLTKVIRVAKTLTSTKDPQDLYKKIVDSAVLLSKADRGWLMLREYHSNKFILRYYTNLPNSIASVIGKPWEDGITSLVVEAEGSLNINEIKSGIKEVSKLGKSVLAVPIYIRGNILGTIVLMRTESNPYKKSTQKIVETISDFASISLANAGFFEITKPDV